jgi:hypothetical protein
MPTRRDRHRPIPVTSSLNVNYKRKEEDCLEDWGGELSSHLVVTVEAQEVSSVDTPICGHTHTAGTGGVPEEAAAIRRTKSRGRVRRKKTEEKRGKYRSMAAQIPRRPTKPLTESHRRSRHHSPQPTPPPPSRTGGCPRASKPMRRGAGREGWPRGSVDLRWPADREPSRSRPRRPPHRRRFRKGIGVVRSPAAACGGEQLGWRGRALAWHAPAPAPPTHAVASHLN